MNTHYGIVREKRLFKWGGFFLLETFGQVYQCVAKDVDITNLKSESYVKVEGIFTFAKINKLLVAPDEEIIVSSIETLSTPTLELPFDIYKPTLNVDLDNILNNRQASLRSDQFKSVFKIQASIQSAFRNILDGHGFTCISTPKIVANGAEGGTNVFEINYFDKPAYLTQSPQLYKQMMCAVFGAVYETAPVFRAERHNSSRHINEYLSLDVEMALHKDFYELIEMEKTVLRYVFFMLKYKKNYFSFLEAEIPSEENLEKALILKVSEIKEMLGTEGSDLSSEEEIEICKIAKEKHGTDFVFATHYRKEVRPFYTKLSEDGIHTNSFDLLFKGIEITSGGQRKEKYEEYIASMKEANMNIEPFTDYLKTFQYGAPLHGGFAIGLERLTAKLCNLPSVKLATLFPRDVDRLTP